MELFLASRCAILAVLRVLAGCINCEISSVGVAMDLNAQVNHKWCASLKFCYCFRFVVRWGHCYGRCENSTMSSYTCLGPCWQPGLPGPECWLPDVKWDMSCLNENLAMLFCWCVRWRHRLESVALGTRTFKFCISLVTFSPVSFPTHLDSYRTLLIWISLLTISPVSYPTHLDSYRTFNICYSLLTISPVSYPTHLDYCRTFKFWISLVTFFSPVSFPTHLDSYRTFIICNSLLNSPVSYPTHLDSYRTFIICISLLTNSPICIIPTHLDSYRGRNFQQCPGNRGIRARVIRTCTKKFFSTDRPVTSIFVEFVDTNWFRWQRAVRLKKFTVRQPSRISKQFF